MSNHVSDSRKGRHVLLWMLGVLVVIVVPSVVLPTLVCRRQNVILEDYGLVPPFTFTDETGQPFTQEALHGHITIVNFIFTRCESICPVTSMKMQKLQEKTGTDVKLVSFSVDPDYDTPARLAAYAKRFAADPSRWHFITGPLQATRDLVQGPFMNAMNTTATTQSGAPDIAHNGHFLLIDTELHIRGLYDSSEITRLEELLHHARYLVRTSAAQLR
jgi:protein SCO1